MARPRPPEIEARAAQHQQRHTEPAHQLAPQTAGNEKVAVQVVEEAYPARHRLLRLQDLQRHRIDQDLQAAGKGTLSRHAALRLTTRLRGTAGLRRTALLRCTALLAAELRPLVGHAGPRQADGSRFAGFDRPANGDRHAPRLGCRGLGRLDQVVRRAPFAGRLDRRFALAQQMLDIVGVDQHRAGHAHHDQGQQQDQADPKMDLLQPVAKGAALRLGCRCHGPIPHPGPGRSGWSPGPPHKPGSACRRR